ncbi:HAD superfamily hydrolase [Halapricum desulfuricans]|uniref:HAD superfamily hydrolase n=2 Tax=Halapricum desulfuricans TaxID=2841257 RepID=A0A897NGP5_9EURY|nr:HAD superfamily hydrolase [Halapricum desulfuricans]
MMTEYDAVLLDLDGTLCEYTRGTEQLLPAAFERVGVEPMFAPEAYVERVDSYADRADSMLERRRLCFADLAAEHGYDRQLGREVADAYAAERDHSNVRFLDGAAEAVEQLAERYPLAMVTNGGPDMQDPKLETLGLERYLDSLVYAGYEVPAKPDPEPFERALDALGVSADRAVYVGNNYETDVLGAASADLSSILVGEPPASGPVEPISTVSTPGEIPRALEGPSSDRR